GWGQPSWSERDDPAESDGAPPGAPEVADPAAGAGSAGWAFSSLASWRAAASRPPRPKARTAAAAPPITRAPKAISMIESATPMDCRPMAVNRMMTAQRTTVDTVPDRIRPMIMAMKKPATMIAPPNSTLPPSSRIALRIAVTCGKPSTWAPITAKNSTTAISTMRSTVGVMEEPSARISCLISQPSMLDPSRIGRNSPETKRAISTPIPTSTTAAMMFGIAVNTAVSICEAGSEIEAIPRICSAAIDTTIMISAYTTEASISRTVATVRPWLARLALLTGLALRCGLSLGALGRRLTRHGGHTPGGLLEAGLGGAHQLAEVHGVQCGHDQGTRDLRDRQADDEHEDGADD